MNAEGYPSYGEITKRHQRTWASGDFHEIGRQTIPLSESLVKEADPRPGQKVLDVACGSGNAALVAARRFCDVAGLDYVPALIERSQKRALAEGLEIDFRVGDAQALPFPDSSFDMVLSVIGVMFAPDQQRAAGELLRVCRPGGAIGLVSWMPDHFGGDFFAAHARHAPPLPGTIPPVRWGTEQGLEELLGDGTTAIRSERFRSDILFARSLDHAVTLYSTYFGPTIIACEAAGVEGSEDLLENIAAVLQKYNRAKDDAVIVEAEYMMSLATRA